VIVFGVQMLAMFLWGTKPEDGGSYELGGCRGCLVILWLPAYWLVTECLFLATPGKALLGLRVYSLAGSEPGFLRMLQRSFAKMLDTIFLPPLGLAIALTNPLRQTGHDIWTRTMVVEEKALGVWKSGPGGQTFEDWLKSVGNPPPPAGP
jgi:uncharacterized RDD family membrane protein YckC